MAAELVGWDRAHAPALKGFAVLLGAGGKVTVAWALGKVEMERGQEGEEAEGQERKAMRAEPRSRAGPGQEQEGEGKKSKEREAEKPWAEGCRPW